jgi:hypothetical protein
MLRRLARKSIWRPYRVRRARAMPHGWDAGLRPGINELDPTDPRLGAAGVRIAAPKPRGRVTHPLDLDIGEVALGHHLVVRGISLTSENLILEWAFVPEVAEEASGEVWPNMNYGADVSPPGWNQGVSDWDGFERPVPEARHAWLDFFHPDYDWMGHFDRRGQPDSDYLRNRIARLTFNLNTAEAHIEK